MTATEVRSPAERWYLVAALLDRREILVAEVYSRALELIAAEPKLSRCRAEELAGAELVRAYWAQLDSLEACAAEEYDAEGGYASAVEMYEDWAERDGDAPSIREFVIDLTGHRTLLIDTEDGYCAHCGRDEEAEGSIYCEEDSRRFGPCLPIQARS